MFERNFLAKRFLSIPLVVLSPVRKNFTQSDTQIQKAKPTPTRRQPPQSGGLPRRKTFFAILILRAPSIFSSKRKRKFFCSAPRSIARAAGFARGQKISSP